MSVTGHHHCGSASQISASRVSPVVILRRGEEGDLEAMMRIEEDCFGTERFSPEVLRAFLLREDAFVILAVEDDEVVGSAMGLLTAERNEGKIASIAVLRSHRGKGIGALLLEECENIFRAHNMARYTLEVETDNEPALSLYLSRGYEIKGTIKDFYARGRDAYCMEKRVASAGHKVIRPS